MASNMKYIYREYGRWNVKIQGAGQQHFPFQETDAKIVWVKDTKEEALFKAQTYRHTLIVKLLHKQLQDWDDLQRELEEKQNKKGVEVGMSQF